MSAAAPVEAPRSVEAEITYLAPGSFINRRYVAPGVEVNTGAYEPHPVQIRDARQNAEAFTLDAHGFTLTRHVSAVRDFKDNAEVEAVYPAEIVALVKRLTGADEVLGLGWMVRTSGELPKQKVVNYQHRGGVQPPAGEAHVDFTPRTAEARARALWTQAFPGGKPYRRFIASSLWRTFSAPPQDTPLALCEGGSVRDEDAAQNTLVVVDEIPSREEMLRPMAGEEDAVAATIFRHNPAHRWWYFSNMDRDEAILLKFYDSDHSVAWRAPHTAFRDPSFLDARVRESIEVRSIAFFR